MNPAEIAPLSPHATGLAIDTLSAAFDRDPAIRWLFPDETQRRSRLPLMFDWLVDQHLRKGLVLAGPRAEVVLLWARPADVHMSLWQEALRLPLFVRLFGRGILRADLLSRAIFQRVPSGPNWLYLRMVGVRPDLQGKGWGGAGIRAGVQLASAQQMDTCLETATPDNVGLYRALGYEVVQAWRVPLGGPHFWTMHRHRTDGGVRPTSHLT